MIKRGLIWARYFSASVKTSIRRISGSSDLKRWASMANLLPEWDSRSAAIATLIPPGTSVLEFGAGRQVLKEYLPEQCIYIPSDIVSRGEETLICDLNAIKLPDFPSHDVTVFSGVLEYVNNVPRLISLLSSKTKIIIASYALVEFVTNKTDRRVHGWVNDYSSQELEQLFNKHKFFIDATIDWNLHKISLLSHNLIE